MCYKSPKAQGMRATITIDTECTCSNSDPINKTLPQAKALIKALSSNSFIHNNNVKITLSICRNVLLEVSLDRVSYIASSITMEIDDCKVGYILTGVVQ